MGGPRGVHIAEYNNVLATTGVAPAGWKFNMSDWWVEEYGRIMEKPEIPIQAGTYTVSNFRGNPRRVMLVISPMGVDGHQAWELQGARLEDVTHGPCRTGRYRPLSPSADCSPTNMPVSNFPVHSGGKMPTLDGCDTLDYRVLFVHAFEPAVMQTLAPSAVAVTKTMVSTMRSNQAAAAETSTTSAAADTSLQGTTEPLLDGDIGPLSCSPQILGRLFFMTLLTFH